MYHSCTQQVVITCIHCAVHLIWNLLSGSFRHPTHTRDETRHLSLDHVCKGALFRRDPSPSQFLSHTGNTCVFPRMHATAHKMKDFKYMDLKHFIQPHSTTNFRESLQLHNRVAARMACARAPPNRQLFGGAFEVMKKNGAYYIQPGGVIFSQLLGIIGIHPSSFSLCIEAAVIGRPRECTDEVPRGSSTPLLTRASRRARGRADRRKRRYRRARSLKVRC